MSGDLVVGLEARREHETQIVLLEQIADSAFDAGLGPGIRDLVETERRHIIVGRLLCIADVELDVVPIDLGQRMAAQFR